MEMEARSAEIAVMADAAGSASTLVRTNRAVRRKMRHADADVAVAKAPRAKRRAPRKDDRSGR
jgi:hypothetical protein